MSQNISKSFLLTVLILAFFVMPLGGCKAEDAGDMLVSPLSFIAVDLDGDGIELVSLEESGVSFDVDGDGFSEHTQWIHPDDGLLLIRSYNEKRKITSPFRVIINWYTDLLSKLQTYDSNKDKRYDSEDYIDIGRSTHIQELNVTILKDEHSLGVVEDSRSKNYEFCELGYVNFAAYPDLSLSCNGRVYSAKEVRFEYQDNNSLWKVVCAGASKGAAHDVSSKEDYLKFCIEKHKNTEKKDRNYE